MPQTALPRAARPAAISRLRSQAGFTMVEVLVAMLLLLVGMLATFLLVGNANATLSKTRAREAATNLARELLEGARDTSYNQIGQANWFQSTLQNTSGGTGSVTAAGSNGQQTTIVRRGVSYAVTVTWCSLDDNGDGYGSHGSSVSWCSDSASTSTTDPQPEDYKRVTSTITWSFAGKVQPVLVQTATFSATGAAAGPTTTNLVITSPSGLSATAPVITTNPTGGIVTFLGTSVGAADMKFFVDSNEQQGTTTNNNNGTWSFNWNITAVPDGVYTISTVAVDALGNRGPPRALQVKLARGAVAAPANVGGGYNYVYASGNRTLAVELNWDANVEGSVTGYQVNKGATVVCSASQSLECLDLTPSSTGSTTYTVKTLYTDAAGNPQSVSTNYAVTAPPIPGFLALLGQPTCGATTMTATVPSGGVAAGNRVILLLETRGGAAGTVSGTDSRGNSYASDADVTNVDQRSVVLSANVTTALAAGDTVRVTYPSAPTAVMSASVFTGLLTTNAVDATGTAIGSSSAPSASLTTTNASDVVIGNVSTANLLSATQPANWLGTYTQGQCGGGSGGNSTQVAAYRNTTATGTFTYNPTTSNTARWASAVVAYKTNPTAGLPTPGAPGGLSASAGANGTTALTWTAPTGTPAADFYRVYRDGLNYTNRYDTVADTGTGTVTWTDTSTGGVAHTYRVTSVSTSLVESVFAGPVTQ
jgi:type IV pilus modification protein PilV